VCDVIYNEALPFRPYYAGVATRTRNVSEYMLVLALCLVAFVKKVINIISVFSVCVSVRLLNSVF